MASLEEIRQARLAKLQILKERGINPYPSKVPRDFPIDFLKKNFDKQTEQGRPVSIAGRVMALRGQGAILFAVLFDGTARIQAIIKKDVMNSPMSDIGESSFELFVDTVDVGDFISVTGVPMLSERGEQSVMAESWVMATKSLLPLPEKWHGLQDVDERYRKRYLDFLMNPELRELIVKKSKFWDATRQFMKNTGFLEVETPTLETTTGGAEATPFETHHNDFDLEFYWAFADFNDGMELVREMYIEIAKEVFGKTKFTSGGYTFDLVDEWKKIDYCQEVLKQTGIDVLTEKEEEMMKKLDELGVKYEGQNRERLTDTLWKYCRKSISGPAYLINHPTVVAPLSKSNPDGLTTQRFQPIIAGSEVGNGYSELNDPIDQKKRFDEQKILLEAGDTEAMMQDNEFVEMLEYGMPPTCGFGFGERLFAILADKSLRESQTFPLMRPK